MRVSRGTFARLAQLFPQECGRTVTRVTPKGEAAGPIRQCRAQRPTPAKEAPGGLVERPVELSLLEIQVLGKDEHITMHHCIQGWSGIAQWGGVPMKTLVEFPGPPCRNEPRCPCWTPTQLHCRLKSSFQPPDFSFGILPVNKRLLDRRSHWPVCIHRCHCMLSRPSRVHTMFQGSS